MVIPIRGIILIFVASIVLALIFRNDIYAWYKNLKAEKKEENENNEEDKK